MSYMPERRKAACKTPSKGRLFETPCKAFTWDRVIFCTPDSFALLIVFEDLEGDSLRCYRRSGKTDRMGLGTLFKAVTVFKELCSSSTTSQRAPSPPPKKEISLPLNFGRQLKSA